LWLRQYLRQRAHLRLPAELLRSQVLQGALLPPVQSLLQAKVLRYGVRLCGPELRRPFLRRSGPDLRCCS